MSLKMDLKDLCKKAQEHMNALYGRIYYDLSLNDYMVT